MIKKKPDIFPCYIDLFDNNTEISCCLKRVALNNAHTLATYYRHAGEWEVDVEMDSSGILRTTKDHRANLSQVQVYTTSELRWADCNGEYVENKKNRNKSYTRGTR